MAQLVKHIRDLPDIVARFRDSKSLNAKDTSLLKAIVSGFVTLHCRPGFDPNKAFDRGHAAAIAALHRGCIRGEISKAIAIAIDSRLEKAR